MTPVKESGPNWGLCCHAPADHFVDRRFGDSAAYGQTFVGLCRIKRFLSSNDVDLIKDFFVIIA